MGWKKKSVSVSAVLSCLPSLQATQRRAAHHLAPTWVIPTSMWAARNTLSESLCIWIDWKPDSSGQINKLARTGLFQPWGWSPTQEKPGRSRHSSESPEQLQPRCCKASRDLHVLPNAETANCHPQHSFSTYSLLPLYLSLFFFNFIYLFIYFWLCRVFVSVRGLSPVAASGGHSSSRCAGLSLSRPLLLRSTSSRRAGSVVVAHGPSCSVACGIFPDRGSNPCPLHWQADSQPLRHQGSPVCPYF